VNKDNSSTRRSFLKGSAALAVPLAAVAAPAVVIADEGLKARLARLENEAAIRELHQAWLRRVNTRTDQFTTAGHIAAAGDAAKLFADPEGAAFNQTVRRIAADHAGQPDAIEIAADDQSASGRFACTVEIETPIAQDSTPARMAHAQGDGFVRRTERGVVKVEYAKAAGAWAIAKAEFAPF
jgi:hypothetical protein